MTILRGLSFDVKHLNVKEVQFIETIERKADCISPLLVVKCKEY